MQSFIKNTFCLVFVISVTVTGNYVGEIFRRSGIVPYVIRNAPKEQCVVNYTKSGIVVRIGELLRNNDTAEEPVVQFNYRDGRFYTIFLIDPDVPSPEAPVLREYKHWILGNVQGGRSYPLVVYQGPAPPSVSPHRYIVLVYQQPGSLCFDEPRITNQ
ncbi:hypothetical protein JYU34_009746 [Plutella xylostella]|uniref:Uncharacterized protein n=1 Tax=Plutella xylostella TaxID=51655 RepID=A0ABQ7QKD1_PLUXY|nr:hypothetical protein JYU34_009746 [Plutella xylostella]